MMWLLPIVIFAGIQECIEAAGGSHWSYEGDSGPSHWGDMFFTCKGNRQSPINIETANVMQEYLKPFSFKYYDLIPTRMRVKNNGHSAQVEIDASNAPRVSGGGLNDDYIFAQFHFHWGGDSAQGSEHTIDGVRYPLEMHLVHYKKSYGSLQESVKHSDGLAVMGVLFEVQPTENAAFTPLVEALQQVREEGKMSDVSVSHALGAFLPKNKDGFYRYLGSLTTPTCNEVVIWSVFANTVGISENQLNAFRSLLTVDHRQLINNFRPPQQLRTRKVYVAAGDNAGESASMKKLGLALYFMSTMGVLMMNM